MARKINAPGIEINEIDRSSYNSTTDNSLVDTNVFIMGFADKGDDYDTKWINSIDTFINTYGYPTNEAERYFFNAGYEVLYRGGRLFATKLPYDNNTLDKFAYMSYCVSPDIYNISSLYDITINTVNSTQSDNEILSNRINSIRTVVSQYYNFIANNNPDIDTSGWLTVSDIESKDIKDCFKPFYEVNYLYSKLYKEIQTYTGDKTNITIMLKCLSSCMDLNSSSGYDGSVDGISDFTEKCVDDKIRQNVYDLLTLNSSGFKKESFISEDGSIKTKFSNDLIEYIYDNISIPFEIRDCFNDLLSDNFICNNIKHVYDGEFDQFLYDDGNTDHTLETYDNIQTIKTILSKHYSTYDDLMFKFTKTKTFNEIKDYCDDIISICDDNCDYWFRFSVPLNSVQNIIENIPFYELNGLDYTISSYSQISSNPDNSGYIDIHDLDSLIVGNIKPNKNEIRIVDLTRKKYDKDEFGNQIVGIIPIITTAANAIYAKQLIESENSGLYQQISSISNIYSSRDNRVTSINNDTSTDSFVGFETDIGGESDIEQNSNTLSYNAAQYFPDILLNGDKLDTDYLKYIGVVVVKLFVDNSNNDMIGFKIVESYYGSLNKHAVDKITNASVFIDTLVNNNSNYINLFSNVDFEQYDNNLKCNVLTNIGKSSILTQKSQNITALGLYNEDCDKTISVKTSILNAIQRIFDNNTDKNKINIDIVVDGGISNIAQFIYDMKQSDTEKYYYDLSLDTDNLFKIKNKDNVKIWKSVVQKYDDFCKLHRKDCMFIADGLRCLCLNGESKIVRKTSIGNTIDNSILPYVRYMAGINSSYGAGYLNWFMCTDVITNQYFWCPPSIKAMGVYLYTDTYAHPWNAPAGINRGTILNAYDTAFSPTVEQAGKIYNYQWNYAVNYPVDGIKLEGQKTFQQNRTAFDRVNVRRLFLTLEKQVRYVARYFVYENITTALMERFTDQIDYILKNCENNNGISDYYIVCDERNNNTQSIENNELHCTIAVKPIKALEFLVLNFVCTNQSTQVIEAAESEI